MRLLILRSIFYLHSWSILGQIDSLQTCDTLNPYCMRKDLALITGYQLMQFHFVEIGLGIKADGVSGHHPFTTIYGITNELKISQDLIWGIKAGFWMGNGLNLGINVIHYTDFYKSTLRFRPEFGIGLGPFRVVYGYNFPITNKAFRGINTHHVTFHVIPNLKKIREIEER